MSVRQLEAKRSRLLVCVLHGAYGTLRVGKSACALRDGGAKLIRQLSMCSGRLLSLTCPPPLPPDPLPSVSSCRDGTASQRVAVIGRGCLPQVAQPLPSRLQRVDAHGDWTTAAGMGMQARCEVRRSDAELKKLKNEAAPEAGLAACVTATAARASTARRSFAESLPG